VLFGVAISVGPLRLIVIDATTSILKCLRYSRGIDMQDMSKSARYEQKVGVADRHTCGLVDSSHFVPHFDR